LIEHNRISDHYNFSRIILKAAGPATGALLRHSFAATAAEMGFSELTIAGLLGHSVPGITARYANVPDSALVAAADRVSARIAAALDGTEERQVISLADRITTA
jgi:site-specific recombinase XerD